MEEIFKPIDGYENVYEISNYGRVKSLKRKVIQSNGVILTLQEKILKPGIETVGYYYVIFCYNSIKKKYSVHHLVWDTFGNGKRNGRILQIDHKDGNKLNNRIDNLQLLSQRENISKGHKDKGRKLPTGVCFNKKRNKYQAQIIIKKKTSFLGYYGCPTAASLAYQRSLNNINSENNNALV